MVEERDGSKVPDSRVRRGEAFFRFNLVLKGGLALLKLFGGIFTGSGALLADGSHNLADMLTGLVAWVSFRIAAKPPDEDHHYGHGNAESVAALLVGLVLVATGVAVVWQAVTVGTTVEEAGRGVLALAIAGVSVVANELLARRAFRLGLELSSQGLIALARDDRADALSSVLVVVGVGAVLLGAPWAEPVVTAAIGVWVCVMGLRSGRDGLDVLMDRGDPELRARVVELARAVDEVHGVQEVRVHPLGSHERVDMQISVDGGISVEDGHRIAHRVEEAVRKAEPRVHEVHVHVNPDAPRRRSE